MKLKVITNIIAILLVTIIIGKILYTWSKNNIEKFGNPSPDLLSKFDSVFNNILQTRLYANDYNDRINFLKDIVEKKGTVDGDDYINLINNVKSKLNDESANYNNKGNEIKREINNDIIKKLESDINYFDKKISSTVDNNSTSSNNINSIKSVKYGINLNVKQITPTIIGNQIFNDMKLPNDNPIIMIFLNNGCLTYDPNTSNYSSRHCELTNKKQYFILKKIESKIKLLDHLTGDYADLQKNTTGDDDSYPFNIIYPLDEPNKCISIDFDGIGIINCRPSTLNIKQRWLTSQNNKSCN
jgi:hypothetical protein